MPTEKKSDSSAMNEISKGTFAAVFERAVLGEPLQRMKIDYQNGKKIDFSPSWLYSSFYANSANMAITTAAQFHFNYLAQKVLSEYFENIDDKYHFHKTVVESFIAGALSAVITSPIEAAMISQSELTKQSTNGHKYSFIESSKFIAEHGVKKFYRGLFATTCREAIFTSSYLAITPGFKKSLKENYQFKDSTAWLISVFAIGGFASLASQPFDTINNIQKKADINENLSFTKIVTSYKANELFKGAMLRMIGVMWALGMLNAGPKVYDAIIEKAKKIRK